MRNAALAYAVLDQIDLHPELWNQAYWIQETSCGTAACFAGWAVLLSGEKVDSCGFMEDDPQKYISDRALELLGVVDEDPSLAELADRELFDATNTYEDLQIGVRQIFGTRPTTPTAETTNAQTTPIDSNTQTEHTA